MISIIDYGMGNLRSVEKSLERIDECVSVINTPQEILRAEKLIIPGVGHFMTGVSNLKSRKLWDPLNEAVLIKKIPVLGICLGMQLMTHFSEEGNLEGLGWINATTLRFQGGNRDQKVPHMGWNQCKPIKRGALFRDIEESSFYYFVHSYYVKNQDTLDAEAKSEYGIEFSSSFEKDNIYGCQFHPEKSHDAGLEILKNFAKV